MRKILKEVGDGRIRFVIVCLDRVVAILPGRGLSWMV